MVTHVREEQGVKVTVAGRIDCLRFQQCRRLVQDLASVRSEVQADVQGMVETEWEEFVERKAQELGGNAAQHKQSPLVYYDDSTYIGGLKEFAAFCGETYGLEEYEHRGDEEYFASLAQEEYGKYMASTGHIFCYMDFVIEKEVKVETEAADVKPETLPVPLGRVVFELYRDVCPRTAENFRALCTGEKGVTAEGVKLHYLNAPIHRVAKDGWVQGGDIVDGSGSKGCSIYGPTFADESFSVKQRGAGMLAMANSGAHTNNSQFFISLQKLEWLDCKKVVFGRVISGMSTVRKMSNLPLRNHRPASACRVSDCGVISVGEP